MNIDKYLDAVKNCRFCFMCRHLSAVGNVTFTEADTPRVRAAMIYGATLHPEWWSNPEYIDMLYRSDLSRNCAHHCVNHYDENALNIAARTDIVEKGFAPAAVKALRDELISGEKWAISGKADVLYFIDPYTEEAKIAEVFAEIMKKAGKDYATISGGCIGRALKVLGFAEDAKQALEKFVSAIGDTGAKTLVVSNPAAYEFLKNDAVEFGVAVPMSVMHTSEYLLTLDLPVAKPAGKLYYLESDYLRNYNDLPFPHELLKHLGADEQHFGADRDWLGVPDQQESFTCGEGAVVMPKLYPELVKKLAAYVEKQADDPKQDRIVVASPYTKIYLSKYTALNVETLEETVLKSR